MQPFKSIGRVLIATLVALLVGGSFTAPTASAAPNVSEKVGKSIVFIVSTFTGQVEIPFKGGSEWSELVELQSTCTGYVVDPAGFIATAGHCVDLKDPSLLQNFRTSAIQTYGVKNRMSSTWMADSLAAAERGTDWRVGTPDDPSQVAVEVSIRQSTGPDQVIRDWTKVQVVDFQSMKQGDNALLKLNSGMQGLTPLPISDKVPSPGEPVVSIGYPGAVRKTNDSSALPQPSYKTGTVSSRQVSESGTSGTEISAEMGSGMSGGPTVNENGEVVGTNSWGTTKAADPNASFKFITDNIALRGYLQGKGVKLAEAEKPAEDGMNILVWLIPVIVVGLLLIGLIAFLVLRKKKKGKGGNNGPSPFGPSNGQGFGQGPNQGFGNQTSNQGFGNQGFGQGQQQQSGGGFGNSGGGFQPPQQGQPNPGQQGPGQPGQGFGQQGPGQHGPGNQGPNPGQYGSGPYNG